MDYKKAINYIVERRKGELFNAELLFSEALKSSPELEAVEKSLRDLTLENIKSGKIDEKKRISLQKQKDDILKSIGLTDILLNPPPHCETCADTGLNGSSVCGCVKKVSFSDKSNLKIPLNSFLESDFTLYDPENAISNQRTFADIAKIAALYPDNKKRNLTLMGATGTGKTFLAGCFANAMLERGFSVVAISAFDFLNRALKYHTTFNDSKLNFITPLLDCSLLVIDDLGTESILKNVTVEYLYTVLNERMSNDCLTLFTTNLSPDGILSRYGERFYSRLFSKSIGYYRVLEGKDLRVSAKL